MVKINIVLGYVICFVFASLNAQTIEKKVDVLIIGGSTSGTSAGISAARLGVKTLIVEETPWIGGMFTSQGVGACDGNNNLNSGIWNEFRNELRSYYGGAEALETGWVSNTLFEPSVGFKIFSKMAKNEKNLEVINGYYSTEILKKGNSVIGAVFQNEKKEKLKVIAKITIDATDIGENIKMAGASYRLGMDSRLETGEKNAPVKANTIVQDLTWVAILKDFGKGTNKTIAKPSNYNSNNFTGCCKETVDGDQIDCEKMLTYGKLPNEKYMINWPTKGNDVYLDVVELTREQRKKELEKAKNYTLQFVYYIQKELGFSNLGLAEDEFNTPDKLAYAPYYREGRRLKGLAYMTYEHAAKPYDQKEDLYRTGISVGDYPVDHHHKQNPSAPHIGFPPVPSFSIPLGTLIPEKTDGFIVSDKAISVSNLINGSTRLQPVVLLTGQAAGTLAAVSVKENKNPREISVRQIQTVLLENGAYIFPLYDVNPTDPDFKCLQKIAATGILKTTGEPYKWANRTWFYPENTVSVKEFTQGLNKFYPSVAIIDSDEILTLEKAQDLLVKAGSKKPMADLKAEPVTRRQLSKMLESQLNPFAKEIDFKGKIIKK